MKEKIVFISASENTVIYLSADAAAVLSLSDIKKWFISACNEVPTDVYYVDQNDLQYYCIDGRVHVSADAVPTIKKLIAA